MAVKITTGEYTQIVVSNKRAWAEIKTATEFKADASAKTEEVRAFNDGGEPLVISTDMGQTTGSISVIRSSSVPFECLAMGKSITHTGGNNLGIFTQVTAADFVKFTLKDAISNPLYLGANFKDKITSKIYGSQWITMAFLNSDGTQEAVAGTLANTYSYTATMKYSFPYAIAIGTKAQFDADLNQIDYVDSLGASQDFLPAGTDSDGVAITFKFVASTGAYVTGTPGATDIVAWLTKFGTDDQV